MKRVLSSGWAQAFYLFVIAIGLAMFWVWRVAAPDAPLFSSAFWTTIDGAGHAVTGLAWVDTTLAAGLLAVVAGGFVFVAAGMEARRRAAERSNEVIDRAIGALQTAPSYLLRLELMLATWQTRPQLIDITGPLIQLAADVRVYYAFHAALLTYGAETATIFAALDAGRNVPDQRERLQVMVRKAQAWCMAMRYFAIDAEDELKRSRSAARQQFPLGRLPSDMRSDGLDLEDIRGLGEVLFSDFPAKAVQ